MKINIINKLIICLIALNMVACTKQNEVPINVEDKINLYDNVGQSHNEALDYIYRKTFNVNSTTSYNDVKKEIINYFLNVQPIFNDKAYCSNFCSTDEFDSDIKLSISSKSILTEKTLNSNKYSIQQINTLKDLDNIIDSDKSDFDNLLFRITELENVSKKNLTKSDLPFILMTISIAKSSLSYWHSYKGQEWLNSLKNKPIQQVGEIKTLTNLKPLNIAQPSVDWSNVAKADIAGFLLGFPAGAIEGAQVGAVALGIETAGLAALPGLLIGGAVGGTATGLVKATAASSAALAAEYLWNWLS